VKQEAIPMQVEPLSQALGVELVDFDVTGPIGDAEQGELRKVFAEHHLLLVRGQTLGDDDQHRFVGCFGPVHVVRSTGAAATYVSNAEDRMLGFGTGRLLWHTDGTHGLRPGIATSLWAEELEPGSAPTMFANGVRALEHLPPQLRARVEPLHAVHMKDTHVERTDRRLREDEIDVDAEPGRYARHTHPIVYPLPHIDAQTLLVNELQTSHVVELARDEGEALLQDLFARIYASENVYSHAWAPGDLLIWDNLALQHCRPREMGAPRRRLRRQSVDGWYTDEGVLEWTETVVRNEDIIPETAPR
jgi:alpha-ketoglutarate-dependent taurine dioxygenase